MFARLKNLFGRTKPEISPPAKETNTKPSSTTSHSASSAAPELLFYWMRHGPSNANVIYNACKKQTRKTNTKPITKNECNETINLITKSPKTRKATNINQNKDNPCICPYQDI